VKRYVTTRPTRSTVVLGILAVALLVASFLVPGTPVHHTRVDGHRVTETPLGWQEVVIAALRIGGVIFAIVALVRHQKTVETVDGIIREEQANVPHDRSAGVDARGNTQWPASHRGSSGRQTRTTTQGWPLSSCDGGAGSEPIGATALTTRVIRSRDIQSPIAGSQSEPAAGGFC
jgi:hypothetical protein